jgi:hypothetical protein
MELHLAGKFEDIGIGETHALANPAALRAATPSDASPEKHDVMKKRRGKKMNDEWRCFTIVILVNIKNTSTAVNPQLPGNPLKSPHKNTAAPEPPFFDALSPTLRLMCTIAEHLTAQHKGFMVVQ